MPSPTHTQLNALRRMVETQRTLRRWDGGFWTTDAGPGCYAPRVRLGPGVDSAVPSWWVGIATVRAMERGGWVERTNVHPEEWRDERRITDAGRAVVKENGG